jgi:exo-beta-1,3-glucanase (GH17 family)
MAPESSVLLRNPARSAWIILGALFLVALGCFEDASPAPRFPRLESFVTGLYEQVLGRQAGPDEVAAWVAFLLANPGASGASVSVQAFFNSTESLQRPVTQNQYVQRLYRGILGREPNGNEIASWRQNAIAPIFDKLIPGFVASAEFQQLLRTTPATVTITRFYRFALGREPDAPGLAFWLDYVQRTGDWVGLGQGFLNSPEYLNGLRSFSEHVAILYRAFLGRDPDPAGLSGWLGYLTNALAGVQAGFTGSPEFQARVALLFFGADLPWPALAPLVGLDFSPYEDGQDPNKGSVVSEEQMHRRLATVAQHTKWVRFFGSTGGLEHGPRIAQTLGLKVVCAAWLGRVVSANDRELANVIAVAKEGHCNLAIIGSEVLLRGDLTAAALIGYVNRFKQAVPWVPVTTADVYGQILAHPEVVAAVDVVAVNYYPYWEGVEIEHAVAAIHLAHESVVAAAGGKVVLVSETGWPSCGNPFAAAVPSPQNAQRFAINFLSWARANGVPYLYFSALDEAWKVATEGPQGACWGVFDRQGHLKPGLESVFAGATVVDNWSGTVPPGGPGTPTVAFTFVPPRGSFDNLVGQVLHVSPVDHRIAVYIKVGSGWWTKPFFTNPTTRIRPDGSWTCDITTGGIDQQATAIVAYLIPAGYSPPLVSGQPTLPAELDAKAGAKASVTR